MLSVVEVSLSFDNAVVNAATLKEMDDIWQRRFLLWGIAFAVFGMRIVSDANVGIAGLGSAFLAESVSTRYVRCRTDANEAIAAYAAKCCMNFLRPTEPN